MSEANNMVLERTYEATAQELWELWTTKEGFESWWGPEGFRVEVDERGNAGRDSHKQQVSKLFKRIGPAVILRSR